ncbi:gibberellin 20-oxidase-like protein [Nymphaea colorata]|nr:gibberellin 20-oxidase-like protein [Nymphaea colorata]
MTAPEAQPEFPLIMDMSKPLEETDLASLYYTCQEWGIFLVANHGIPMEVPDKVYSLSKPLFNFPFQAKRKIGPGSTFRSYTPPFVVSPFFESIRVNGPDFGASATNWSSALVGEPQLELCEALGEYGAKLQELAKRIVSMLLASLGDGMKKAHESEFARCHGYLRINNYIPPDGDCVEFEGLGMHTDMSCITIVYQDQIGGLKARANSGEWVDIEPREGVLAVNIGDMLRAWSNGKLRASEHKVVLKASTGRLSMAFFWSFEDEKVIWAPEEMVGKGFPRVYKPFLCLDYVKFREEGGDCEDFDRVGITVDDFARIRDQEYSNSQTEKIQL